VRAEGLGALGAAARPACEAGQEHRFMRNNLAGVFMPSSPPNQVPIGGKAYNSADELCPGFLVNEKLGPGQYCGYNRLAKVGCSSMEGVEPLGVHVGDNLVSDSTTFWVKQLKAGNREAAQAIWERYYRRLIGLARKRLSGRGSLSVADENDIAQSAFASFYRAAEQGRFPQLANSSDLWRLLIVITQRKISRQLRHQNCRKRKPDANVHDNGAKPVQLDELVGSEPTPEFCVIAIESFRQLLDELPDDTLRSLAVMKMEGYTNEEMSNRLSCSLSTIERKLRRIRHEWTSADAERIQ